jgi:3-hydroxy-9,10-secoandrosta-1,3,5(10)-triene-9,17-dione monooxygenase reductase component
MAPAQALAAPEEIRPDLAAEPGLPAEPDLDPRHFRDVLGTFATGVVALTALDSVTGCPTGLTANSFTAVSLRPPLVSVCVSHASTTWPRIRAARGFCVNVLAAHQQNVCLQLATPGVAKFRNLTWTFSPAGHPVLDGALGTIDCVIEAEHVAGDHVVVICRVRRLDVAPADQPLIFYRGGYGTFAPRATQTWP